MSAPKSNYLTTNELQQMVEHILEKDPKFEMLKPESLNLEGLMDHLSESLGLNNSDIPRGMIKDEELEDVLTLVLTAEVLIQSNQPADPELFKQLDQKIEQMLANAKDNEKPANKALSRARNRSQDFQEFVNVTTEGGDVVDTIQAASGSKTKIATMTDIQAAGASVELHELQPLIDSIHEGVDRCISPLPGLNK